jgi:Ca2+-binding RTX toxin-like protein
MVDAACANDDRGLLVGGAGQDGPARLAWADGGNHAPLALYVPAPAPAEEALPFSVVLPSEMFYDQDPGDTGTMSVDGLPPWLAFDPLSRTLSGTAAYSDAGTLPLTVRWTDGGGLQASIVMTLRVEQAASVALSGGQEADILSGRSNHDYLRGLGGDDRLDGMAGNDTLDGGAGKDTLAGGSGNDHYLADAVDLIVEAAGAGLDQVVSASSLGLADNVEVLSLSGTAALTGTGNALDNLLKGNAGANLLDGLDGIDLLQGAAGNDTLSDALGRAGLLDGGTGADRLLGGDGNSLFIGGKGADFISTGAGQDIIAFNRGDGIDTVAATGGADNTVSLGGGIGYADLLLSKVGQDLVLGTGRAEQIVFQDWYAAPGHASVATLQLSGAAAPGAAAGGRIALFDFGALVARFDEALAQGASSWSAWSALEQCRRGASDTAAIGGDLAQQYALNGKLSNIGMLPALDIIGSPAFGIAAQSLFADQAAPGALLNDGSPLLF